MKVNERKPMISVFKNLKIDGILTDIISENGVISIVDKVDRDGVDFHGMKAYAGLIDIHTHGMKGMDTMDGNIGGMAKLYAESGTTTFYPTTMTASNEKLKDVLVLPEEKDGAKVPGFHMEGPYISPDHCGAQNGMYVRSPDISEFAALKNVKLITVAPELEGAMEFIRDCGCVVCLGHTDSDYAVGMQAARAGAKCLTHMFNAMPPLHHREPALIGAAFDSDMYVQVICDGKHIHPSVIRMVYKLFGPDRMILISDSMRAAGLPDGIYEFGGLETEVRNNTARTAAGALAGSTSTLFECVKCAVEFGIPEKDAFIMASRTPARLMGLNSGELLPGKDCDMIIVNERNEIDTVIIDGQIRFCK